jgi:hypothetical protein
MDLVFQDHPDVHIGTLTFRRVPTILKFEDVPLIQVSNSKTAGWRTRFDLYHPDGTPIAVVKGARVFLTEEGRKAQFKLHNFPDVIACDLDGHTLFELRRRGPAALSTWAELFTPTGILIKAADSLESLLPQSGGYVRVGNSSIRNALIEDCPVGLKVYKSGGIRFQVSFPLESGGEAFEREGWGKLICRPIDDESCAVEWQSPDGKCLEFEPTSERPKFDPDFPGCFEEDGKTWRPT